MVQGTTFAGVVSQEKAGKVRILAVIEGRKRVESHPQLPTLYECGLKTVLPVPSYIIYGPKGLPDPIVKKLADAFTKGSNTASFKKYASENDVYPTEGEGDTGQELLNSLNTGSKNAKDLMLKLGVIKTKPK